MQKQVRKKIWLRRKENYMSFVERLSQRTTTQAGLSDAQNKVSDCFILYLNEVIGVELKKHGMSTARPSYYGFESITPEININYGSKGGDTVEIATQILKDMGIADDDIGINKKFSIHRMYFGNSRIKLGKAWESALPKTLLKPATEKAISMLVDEPIHQLMALMGTENPRDVIAENTQLQLRDKAISLINMSLNLSEGRGGRS